MQKDKGEADTRCQTIQEAFRFQAQQTPNRLCLRIPKSKAEPAWELSYREMDCWSDALSTRLRAAGVTTGQRVGLCVERSAAAVAAMLAIVKSGAVYVPISPDYPKSRAEFMVEDAGVKVAFATPIFANKMNRVGVDTLLLEEHPETSGEEDLLAIASGTADHPAYIIYTSGSTGRPKGVEVPHRGVLRLVSPINTYCAFNNSRRFLQLAPLFFDAATLEVWAPLLNGGCCVVQPGDGIPDPELLGNVLREEKVTTLWLTSSLFNWLIDNNALINIPVEELLVGGEALSLAHIKRAQEQLPNTQLINGYGPTETTTFACCYRIPNPIPSTWTAIPIGQPIHKTQIFVCNDTQQEVAQGEQGELLIAGDGVSLGYRNLPERTLESFQTLRLGGQDRAVYRTGDQVRINNEGVVEYIGRIDDQIKISGYRIELGEISNCVTAHPEIRDAAVVVHSNDKGDKRLVCYMVARSEIARPPIGEIRCYVHDALPHYMVPNAWVYVDKLPLTANGKLDRDALPEPVATRPDIGVELVEAKDAAEAFIARLWCEHLGLNTVGVNDRYFELGGTSIAAVNFVALLSQELGQRIPIATFFYAPTIRSFVAALWGDHQDAMAKKFPNLVDNYQREEQDLSQYQTNISADDIAIIGFAGRFAGADDTDALWHNLINEVEALRFASDDELRSAGVGEDDIKDPDYVRAYFSFEDLEYFDAHFFGYQPRETELMDPQHRIFLEQAWTALDNAGYSNTHKTTNKISVFGGTARDSYVHHYVSNHEKYKADIGEFYVNMGNDKNFPATRVAYQMNLKGPAVNVQTACSSAGTALHLATQSLKNGDCDIAVIGGCRALVPQKSGYRHLEEGALSVDGHLRAFDAQASGMVRGSGAAFVVIKRLKDALADGDCVRAVIKATAINNDGNAKVGYTAPSVEGQVEAITKALVLSGISPDSIGYVETHGTGTLLGDPIEVAALTKSYRRFTQAKGYSRIGSIKTNIGHTDAGSAIAGMIKAILALEHGKIPASLNYTRANPNIDFENSPFQVCSTLQDWPIKGSEPRYAAVSSFGLGGTNFHAILEQAPKRALNQVSALRPLEIVTLSAKTGTALNANIAGVSRYLSHHAEVRSVDLAYSLNEFRSTYKERALLLVTAETTGKRVKNIIRKSNDITGKPVLFFPGTPLTTGLTQPLYQSEPVFRNCMNLCAGIFETDYGIDVLAALYSPAMSANTFIADARTRSAAQFCIEYAYAKLWINWTEMPAQVISDGLSLPVAACIADMLSVHKAIEVSQAIAIDRANNGNTALNNALENIIPAVAKVKLRSGTTGKTITIQDLMNAEVWLSNASINNGKKIDALFADLTKDTPLFCVSLGHCVEDTHSDLNITLAPEQGFFTSIVPENSDDSEAGSESTYRPLFVSIGQYWLAGHQVNWKNVYAGQQVSKVPLPAYKFDRKRYLIDLPEREPQLLLFQAASATELQDGIRSWKDFFAQAAKPEDRLQALQKLALPATEVALGFRTGIAAITPAAMAHTLRDGPLSKTPSFNNANADHEIVYLLPGGGAQFLEMGKGLYERHPIFRESIDAGFALFGANTGHDLRALVFPAEHYKIQAEALLKRPSLQLPAIFIVQMALAKLWTHWGAKPNALIGHSLGENTAACLAGVLSYDDALGLVSLRGQLFETVEAGGMLSIALSAQDAKTYLGEKLDLATINSPGQCTISGTRDALDNLARQLEKDNIDAQTIPIEIAAHSRYLEPILAPFRAYLCSVKLNTPNIPFISNTTGTWITDAQATSPDYWVNHLRSTVRFSDGVQTLLQKSNRIYLEVGPGKILGSLVKLHDVSVTDKTLSSLRHAKEEVADVVFSLNTAARLWALGVEIDWRQVDRDFPNSCLRLPAAPPSLQPAITSAIAETLPALAPYSLATATANIAHSTSIPMPVQPLGASAVVNRREFIETTIKDIIYDMSGITSDALNTSATFVDLGFDSLFLTQANGRMKKAFKLKLTLKQLMSEAPSIALLSDYIEDQLPAGALAEEMAASVPTAAPTATNASTSATGSPAVTLSGNALAGLDTNSLAYVLAAQIQASNALLSIIQGGSLPTLATPTIHSTPAPTPSAPPKPKAAVKTATAQAKDSPTEAIGHGPFRPIVKAISGALTEQQSQFLGEFMAMYAEKTKGSKKIAADIRPFYADPRTVLGFKTIWKEITYSIVAERSKGSHTWDVDGNEYIDCMGGFGAIFFGHAPDFIMDAVKTQAELSVDYGPQSAMAGETARLICEVTGYDRVSFCNTGSEAVLAATRIARTVTGNDLIVTFSGDYHGIFDEMLIRSQVIGGERRNQPIAPGIPKDSNSNILMLAYDDPESLEIIKQRADEIAGVLIEPIQSRFPEIQPKEFIHQLRKITREAEIPLIFDEVITGFRLHPRGAQAWFDVDADLSCYGKVIGGGMPIGVVAGRAQYMDVLDGGPWQYGDDSFPEAGVTYFAGTFVRHPLAIAASNAVIKKIKAEGPELHKALNYKTAMFAERVNRHYREQDIPVEIVYFGSVFLVRYKGESDFEFLFFLILRINGGHHIWGPRPGFMTIAHSQEDIEVLINAFIIAGNEFRRGGFFHAKEDRPEERYPWTAAQSELWLACELGDSASAAYNEQVCFDIENDIDSLSMEFATDRTINRHPSLRSVVASDKQGMIVKHYMNPEYRYVDLSEFDKPTAEKEYLRLAAENVDKPFDFFNGPLLRTLVVRLADNQTRLCVAASHLVCDGWSLEKIMEDLAGYYTAIYQGRHYRGKHVPHLSEFFAAKEKQMQSEEYLDAKKYWCAQYRGKMPSVLELPLDHPRPKLREFNGERQEYQFSNSVMQPLRAYAKEQGCTSFVLLLTAFKLLLSRLSGEQDVIVGVPSAGQPNIGMPTLIAHDVSFLPLRSNIDGSKTFQQLLLMVRDNFLDAKDNQDFSYGELIQTLNVPREPGRLPLISANFNLDFPFNPLDFDGSKARFLSTPRNHVKYDLSFNLTDEGEFLRVEVDHCSDLFDRTTVERWVNNYLELLKHIGTDPDTPVSKLRLNNESDIQRLLEKWNDTDKSYPLENATLHGLIEVQAEKTPGNTAVVFEGQRLNYKELNEQSNQLAHYLRKLGVTKNQPVAVLLDRALGLPISLLAILKAGGAYLPLDPDYPTERIAYILQEAEVKTVLSSNRYLAEIPDSVQCIIVDELGSAVGANSIENLDVKSAPDDLAYIIYTSGSTGKPKGVMIEHRSICNRLFWMQEDFALDSRDKVLQKTPYTFDVSVWEFFLPLITGATLVVAKPDGHKDSDYLIETMIENQISHAHFVPSMLTLFLANSNAKKCQLKRVVCSGEALTMEQTAHFFETFDATELHNYYGPTEAAVDVTKWQCQKNSKIGRVPIGKPVANTQIYILDEFMQPVAEGSCGELYIGGVQVARGYINREELTKERFVSNPFSAANNPGSSRLYKTGDIGRYLENGDIEYLGRNDFQVKVRGLRIELGEIEVALCKHANIQAAVVIAREDRKNDVRLAAYIVTNSDAMPEYAAIRAHLLTQIPEYMVPQYFVDIASIPLTSSGKVDRKALPVPAQDSAPTGTAEFETDIERTIGAWWCELLGTESVGATDDFFELGGHSLLGVQLIGKINQKFSTNFGLRQLFLAPNIRQQAELITQSEAESLPAQHICIEPHLGNQLPPASSQQQRLWYLEQIDPDTQAYNMEVSYFVHGELNISALELAFNTVISRHQVLRTNFEFREKSLLQVISPTRTVTLATKDLPESAASSKAGLHSFLQSRSSKIFNFETDNLFSVELYKIDSHKHVLFILVHHLVFDGWSFDILMRELSAVYNAKLNELDPTLPALPVQYGDYALWQHEQAQSPSMKLQLNYWLDVLSGELPILDLPEDFPRPAQQASKSLVIPIAISESTTIEIERLCKTLGCTLFMFLISAYTLTLHRHSKQKDIIVGAPVSGRSASSINSLLGFFVNTVAFRFNVQQDISFADWLNHVKQVCIDAYANQDLPYEVLVKNLNPERDLSRSPIFQAFFLFEDVRERKIEFSDLSLEQIEVERSAVQTDLDFWLKRRDMDIVGGFDYPVELFSEDSVKAIADSFLFIINSAIENPQLELSTLNNANNNEQNAINGWNSTAHDFGNLLFLERLSMVVKSNANRRAVVSQGKRLNYQDLEYASNQLANYLVKEGVQKGSLVGICLDRSVELLIGTLAIWKAGATYVPLDPEYPPSRLLYMLELSNIQVMLTQSSLAHIADSHSCRRISIDLEAAEIEAMPRSISPVNLKKDDLAYVIFTSGSTGKPKGVEVPHGAMNNFLMSMLSKPGISLEDHVLAVTSLSFDIAGLELFLPLLVGADIVIASAEEAADGTKLHRLIEQESISFMQATPSTWRLLLAANWKGGENFKVLCGGEAFPIDLAKQLLGISNEVWNMYGPTETTIWSSCKKLEQPLDKISIGQPIANTQCYVLNEDMEQLPLGVSGELYIGGSGVTQGYLDRKDLTAERYVPNPFTQNANDRLYRTGDLVSWQRDGTLKYLRRMDNQVKLRGYRLELGEIEAVLSENPSIIESAAMIRRYSATDLRLAAYIRFAQGKHLTSSEIRRFLRSKLPDYMIPQFFVELQKMPLTPNGKIDRNALPDPIQSIKEVKIHLAPRNDIEKAVAKCWAELLMTEVIDINDRFFDIGGHSLLALEAIHKIFTLYGVRISPLDILMNSLEQICALIQKKIAEENLTQVDTQESNKNSVSTRRKKGGIFSRIFE